MIPTRGLFNGRRDQSTGLVTDVSAVIAVDLNRLFFSFGLGMELSVCLEQLIDYFAGHSVARDVTETEARQGPVERLCDAGVIRMALMDIKVDYWQRQMRGHKRSCK